MQNDNYPIGSANDPKAPYNEPLPYKVNVEVGVELGLFLKVEVYDEEEIKEEVNRQIYYRFKNPDTEITAIKIYADDFPNKQE